MNESDLETCAMMRDDELVILESIYPGSIEVVTPSEGHEDSAGSEGDAQCSFGPARMELKIRVDIEFDREIGFILVNQPNNPSDSTEILKPEIPDGSQNQTKVKTKTFPPILVHLDLSTGYPLSEAPRIKGVTDWRVQDRLTHPSTSTSTPPNPPSSLSSQNPIASSSTPNSYLPESVRVGIGSQLQDLWDGSAGEGVLWTWMDWVREGGPILESLEKVSGGDNDGYIFPCAPPYTPQTLCRSIKRTTLDRTKDEFDNTVFTCGICLEARKGRFCVRFDGQDELEDEGGDQEGCGCVFCKDCLSSCWTLAIKEGAIDSVACPSVGCTKDRVDRQNLPAGKMGTNQEKRKLGLGLVESVVGKELRERFEWLGEKKRVENDPTYTICPLQHCQSPVPPPPSVPVISNPTVTARKVFRIGNAKAQVVLTPEQVEENRRKEEDKWERFRECHKCRFVFCRYCLTTWHGPHLPCPLPSTSNFLKAYLALTPDSPERKIYERRYGKKNLDRLQAEFEENEANKKWFESNTRECSGCGTKVQKSQGCNHMICSKCNAHFCYRCGQPLRPSDPYMHYRTQGSTCFEKLFDADEIARFEREVNGARDGIEWDEMVGGGAGGWW